MARSLPDFAQVASPAAAILLAAGSLLHCSLMCGPLAAAATMSYQSKNEGRNRGFLEYQFGRSLSYSLAGFAAASIGHVLQPNPFAVGVFLVIIIALVLIQLFQISTPRFFSIQSGRIYARAASLLSRRAPQMKFSSRLQPFGLGFLTPLIPCGQLWMVLSFAALASTAIEGAAMAFAFSIFTAPGVYGFSFVKNSLLALSAKKPALVKVTLRSAIVFFLALSAVKYSSLFANVNRAEANGSSPTQQICH